MPIDPSIPLQVHPPQIINPMQATQQGLSMQGMIQENKLRQEEVQSEAMKNQQQQIDLQDQQTIRQAYMDAAGDMDKFQSLVTQRGVSPRNLMAVNNSILEMKQKQTTLSESQVKLQAAHGAALASAADQLLGIKDPQQRVQAATPIIQQMQQQGYLTPDVAQQLTQHATQNGITDDDLNMLKAHGLAAARMDPAQAQALARQAQANAAGQQAQTAATRLNTETPGLQAKAEVEQLNAAAQRLANAQDSGTYQEIHNALPYSIGKQFPAASVVFDQNGKPVPAQVQAIRRIGMTPEQQNTADATAAQRTTQNAYEQSRLDLERQRLALERTRTNQQQTADQRQAQSEIQKLQAQEQELNSERLRLGQALTTGNLYIPKTGVPKPFMGMTQDERQDSINDMRARYTAASDALKQTVASKYDQYQRLGANPQIPLKDVYAAIDQGTQSTLNPQPRTTPQPTIGANPNPPVPAPSAQAPARPASTAPPAQPAAQTPKAPTATYTEAQVRARALALKKDPDAAVKLARSKGLLK